MIFNSYAFLAFFPIVTLAYYLLPMWARRPWLLAASYYFYMCWNAQYALLIAASTLVTYLCALALGRMEAKAGRRAVLTLGLAINLGILCFFKYFGFFTDTFVRIAARLGVRMAIPAFDVLLPVGISFYTFQALGYMIDVYRGKLPPERSLMRYALFVSFFPQLVAGPIERSENLLRQVNEDHPLNEKAVRDGLLVMLLGFFEKLVIADRASLYVDAVYGNWQQASGLQILLATVAFAFQIYGDFGGYSHIAIGAAKVLGYDLMENFRQPYFAVSVRDFWRRWHISLSTWFRDYVYIPLGGSRVGAFRRALNVMVTFTISGLWHGAAMNYVAWGAANGALQVAESFLPRRFNEPRGRLGRCAKALLTFIVIDATWLLFRAHALSTALHMAERMIRCAADAPMATGFTFPQALVLVVGLAALGALDALHERGRTLTAWLDRRPAALRMALMLLGVLLVVIFGVWGTNYDAQAFIYFQF